MAHSHAICNKALVIKNITSGNSHVCGSPLWVASVLAINSQFVVKSLYCSFEMIIRCSTYQILLDSHNSESICDSTYIP